jgi:Epoxide hydrolase N terminus
MEATASAESASAEGVRPFTIDIPNEQIKDLRTRVEATHWPGEEIVADATRDQGLDPGLNGRDPLACAASSIDTTTRRHGDALRQDLN